MSALDLFILALASWRLAYFVAKESGPANVMSRTRTRFGGVTTCIYCVSIWTAAIAYLVYLVAPWVMWVFAISGAAMMLYRHTGGEYT